MITKTANSHKNKLSKMSVAWQIFAQTKMSYNVVNVPGLFIFLAILYKCNSTSEKQINLNEIPSIKTKVMQYAYDE